MAPSPKPSPREKCEERGRPILILIDALPAGGTERQVVYLLGGLGGGRFEAHLAVLDHGGALQPEAERLARSLLPVRRRARFDPMPVLTLLREIPRRGIRLVHAFGWMSGLAGLIAARVLGVPIVNGSVRGTPPALRIRERASRWCALRSNAIVANSDAGLAAYGLTGHPRTLVIPNGIDLERFRNVIPEQCARPAICMVANFNEYKDQPTVIRALAAIRKAVADAQLVLVGNDAGTMAASRALAAAIGVDRAVRFVSGVTRPESIVAGSDVCVLMSNEGEGFSNAVLEYMALGKPVVATDCGGNAVLIENGVTGFLVPKGAHPELAARVIELLADRERAEAMGAEGRRRVFSAYSTGVMSAAYENLYERLIPSHA
jgi:glycosyltransferase involved in cell wall biosynthesis